MIVHDLIIHLILMASHYQYQLFCVFPFRIICKFTHEFHFWLCLVCLITKCVLISSSSQHTIFISEKVPPLQTTQSISKSNVLQNITCDIPPQFFFIHSNMEYTVNLVFNSYNDFFHAEALKHTLIWHIIHKYSPLLSDGHCQQMLIC